MPPGGHDFYGGSSSSAAPVPVPKGGALGGAGKAAGPPGVRLPPGVKKPAQAAAYPSMAPDASGTRGERN